MIPVNSLTNKIADGLSILRIEISNLGKRVVVRIVEGSKAAPSYTKGGKAAHTSSATVRLFFGNLNDSRFSVGVIHLENANRDTQHAKIDIQTAERGQMSVAVSVKELADRLHLSRREIIEKAGSGKLEGLLQSAEEEINRLPEVVQQYEKIVCRYEELEGQLAYKSQGVKKSAQITKKQLMKVVRAALLNRDQGTSPSAKILLRGFERGSPLPAAMGAIVEVDGHLGVPERRFLVVKEPQYDLTIVEDPHGKKPSGIGAWGNAVRIQDVSNGALQVIMKLLRADFLRPQMKKLGVEILLNGAKRLRTIHEELQKAHLLSDGIQSGPSAVVCMKDRQGEAVVIGWIGRAYLGDAFDMKERIFGIPRYRLRQHLGRDLTPFESAFAIHHACQGLANLHLIGRPHRDLKVENLLAFFNTKGQLCFDIGDLDTCKNRGEIDFASEEFTLSEIGIFTRQLMPKGDLEQLKKLIGEHEKLKGQLRTIGSKGKDKIEEAMKKRMDEIFALYFANDKFAIAATICEWLTGSLPYLQEAEHPVFPNPKGPILLDSSTLVDKGYPQPFAYGLVALLKHYLHPDYRARTKAFGDFVKEFHQLIVSHL